MFIARAFPHRDRQKLHNVICYDTYIDPLASYAYNNKLLLLLSDHTRTPVVSTTHLTCYCRYERRTKKGGARFGLVVCYGEPSRKTVG